MRSQFFKIGDYTFCLQYEPEYFANFIEQFYYCARSEKGCDSETFILLKNGRYYYVQGGLNISAKDNLDSFFVAFEWEITKKAMAHNGRFHQIHCAGLVYNEQTIIIPGSSNAGKTTLVMELLRRGAKAFTDEIFLIDRNSGEFVAFPRSFLVKENSYALFPEIPHPKTTNGHGGWRKDVEQMTWYQNPQAIKNEPFIQRALLRSGAIFFATYTSGSKLLLNSMTPINVMRTLASHSLNIFGNEENSLMVLGDLARDFPGFSLQFDSLHEAADRIFNTLSTLKKAA